MENSGAFLVSGQQEKQMASNPATRKIKVLRSFYFGMKPLAVGVVAEVPYAFALEMIAAHKATDDLETVVEQPAVRAPAIEMKGSQKADSK